VLEPGDECKCHRLPALVARVGSRRLVNDAVEQYVGVGLEPGGLRVRRGLERPAAGVAQCVEAAVRGDPVEPRAQRGAPLEVLESAPSRQECLLKQVLGVLDRPEDSVAVQLELVPVGVSELPERLLVSRARAGESGVVHGQGFHHP
jgi:hypothetical protein